MYSLYINIASDFIHMSYIKISNVDECGENIEMSNPYLIHTR